MDEQARTKRIALELEKLKHELALQDRELADMKSDYDVTDEAVEACVAKINEQSGANEPAAQIEAPQHATLPPNTFIVRG